MDATEKYFSAVKKKFSMEEIRKIIEQIKDLNVLVIGDSIIDQYIFVRPKGRAIKDPILSSEYSHHENYAGGALAIANHINDFVDKVKLVTLIGDKNDRLDFIKNSLSKNISLKTFEKKESHTIVKKRFVDVLRNNKLFKVEYMNDLPVNKKLSNEILQYLDKELSKYDLVIVGDFGHGFINEDIRKKLEEKSKFLSLNVQTNSSNMGYNYFNLYKKFDFISLDENELRFPLFRRFEDIKEVIKEASKKFNIDNFLITRGKMGCIYFYKGRIYEDPALARSIKDVVGAGDALFAITSLFVYSGVDPKKIPFLANCIGAIAVNIMGNKESVNKDKLLNFIDKVLN